MLCYYEDVIGRVEAKSSRLSCSRSRGVQRGPHPGSEGKEGPNLDVWLAYAEGLRYVLLSIYSEFNIVYSNESFTLSGGSLS